MTPLDLSPFSMDSKAYSPFQAAQRTYDQLWFAFQESLYAQEVLREHCDKFEGIPVVSNVVDKLHDVLLQIHSGLTLKGKGLRKPRQVLGVNLTEAAMFEVATHLILQDGLAADSIERLRHLCYVCRFTFSGCYNNRVAELLVFLEGVQVLLRGESLPASLPGNPSSRALFPLDDPVAPARPAMSCQAHAM